MNKLFDGKYVRVIKCLCHKCSGNHMCSDGCHGHCTAVYIGAIGIAKDSKMSALRVVFEDGSVQKSCEDHGLTEETFFLEEVELLDVMPPLEPTTLRIAYKAVLL